MRNVYICLPFEEDVKGNSEKAKRYAKYAFECGMAPVMPHFYVEIVENQREIRFAQKLNIDILYFTENEKGEICSAKKKKAKKRR